MTNEHNFCEQKFYSQNKEDGITIGIFGKIGATNRTFVEFGVGVGVECNTAILSLGFGWNGLLIEGKEEAVERGGKYYNKKLKDNAHRVKFTHSFVTAENINNLIADNGIAGPIDLLSIDMDGNDYWVWKAITQIKPRVVIIEYNASLGPKVSKTIPYDPKRMWDGTIFHGASLTALTKLGNQMGYKLVAVESRGVNAFFVLNTISAIKARNPKDIFKSHAYRTGVSTQEEQMLAAEKLGFIEV